MREQGNGRGSWEGVGQTRLRQLGTWILSYGSVEERVMKRMCSGLCSCIIASAKGCLSISLEIAVPHSHSTLSVTLSLLCLFASRSCQHSLEIFNLLIYSISCFFFSLSLSVFSSFSPEQGLLSVLFTDASSSPRALNTVGAH